MAKHEAPRIKWLVEPTFDEDGVQRSAGLDHLGREVVDPVPMSPPVGLAVSQGDELQTILRTLLQKERAAFAAAVEAENFETEEEANDFLVPDELFPPGNEPWEDIFDFPVEEPGGAANGSTLASGAVKGEPEPEKPAPPVAPSADRTVSADSSPSSTPSQHSVETPKSGVASASRSAGRGSERG